MTRSGRLPGGGHRAQRRSTSRGETAATGRGVPPSTPPSASPTTEPAPPPALDEHRAELEEKKAEVATELRVWRQEQGGFTSVSRAAGAARELLAGDHRLQRFARQAGDPEATGPSALRLRVQQLQDKVDLVDVAAARLARGEAPLREGEVGTDLVLDEIALALERPLTREDLIAHRSAFLRHAIDDGKVEEALESYVSLAALYLEAADGRGESVHRANGAPSLTEMVNGWLLSGRLRSRGSLVLTSDDLERLKSKILKLARQLQKSGELPEGTPPVTAASVAAEIERLRAIEASPEHRALLDSGVASGHAAMKESTRGKKLSRFGRGVVRMLDDPSTWAMVLIGAVAGQVGRRAMLRMGSAAVEAGNVYAMKEADLLGKVGVQRFVATRAAEGVGFHVGMNAFEVARGKVERATWGLGDFARSVALFEVLGGVQIWQHARHIESAVLRHAANLGEETLGLSLLGLGEVWLRGGDGEDALELLEHNLQFLLAMRLLSAGRWALRGFTPEAAQSIARSKAEARREFRKARDPKLDSEARAAHARAGYRATMAYHELLGREIEALQDAESAKPGAPRPKPLRRELDEVGLAAVAEEAGLDPAWVEEVRAFNVPKSTTTFFREGERARDASLQLHEDLHRCWVALDPAVAEEVVEAFRAADASLDAAEVEELIAEQAAGELEGARRQRFEQILARKHRAGVVADLLAQHDLLVTDENRSEWARRAAELRVPVVDAPARAASRSGGLLGELNEIQQAELKLPELEQRVRAWQERLEQLPPDELVSTLESLGGIGYRLQLFESLKRVRDPVRMAALAKRAASNIDWSDAESLKRHLNMRSGSVGIPDALRDAAVLAEARAQLAEAKDRGAFFGVLFEGLPEVMFLEEGSVERQFVGDALLEYLGSVDPSDTDACRKVSQALKHHSWRLDIELERRYDVFAEAVTRSLPAEQRHDHGVQLARQPGELGRVGVQILVNELDAIEATEDIVRHLEPLVALRSELKPKGRNSFSSRHYDLGQAMVRAYQRIVAAGGATDPDFAAFLVELPARCGDLYIEVPDEAKYQVVGVPEGADAQAIAERILAVDEGRWGRLKPGIDRAFSELLEASDLRSPTDIDRVLEVVQGAPSQNLKKELSQQVVNALPEGALSSERPDRWSWLAELACEERWPAGLGLAAQEALLQAVPDLDIPTVELLTEQVQRSHSQRPRWLPDVEHALTRRLLQLTDFGDDEGVAAALTRVEGSRVTNEQKQAERVELAERLFGHGTDQDLKNALVYLDTTRDADRARVAQVVEQTLSTESRVELARRLTWVVDELAGQGASMPRRAVWGSLSIDAVPEAFTRLLEMSDLSRASEQELVQRLATALLDRCDLDLSDDQLMQLFLRDQLFRGGPVYAFNEALKKAFVGDKISKLVAQAQLRRSLLDPAQTDGERLRDQLERTCRQFATEWFVKPRQARSMSGLLSMARGKLPTVRPGGSKKPKPSAEASAFFESIIEPAYVRLAEIGDMRDQRTLGLLLGSTGRFKRTTTLELTFPEQHLDRLFERHEAVKDIVRASQLAESDHEVVRARAEQEVAELGDSLGLIDALKLRQVALGKVKPARPEQVEIDMDRLVAIAEAGIERRFTADEARAALLEESLEPRELEQRFFLVAGAFEERVDEAGLIDPRGIDDTKELPEADAALLDEALVPAFAQLVDLVDWADQSDEGAERVERLLAFSAAGRRFERATSLAPDQVEAYFKHQVDGCRFRDVALQRAGKFLVHPDREVSARAVESLRRLFVNHDRATKAQVLQKLERVVLRSARAQRARADRARGAATKPWGEVVTDGLEQYDHPAIQGYRDLRSQLVDHLRTLQPPEAIQNLRCALEPSVERDLVVDDLLGRGPQGDGWIDQYLLNLTPDYGTGDLESPQSRLLIAAVATFPEDPTAAVDFLQGRIDLDAALAAGKIEGDPAAASQLERLKQEWQALDPRIQRPLLERAFTEMLEEATRRRRKSPGERDRFREVIEERVVRIFDRDEDAKKLSERVYAVTDAFPPYLQARIVASLLTSPPTEDAPQLLRQLLVAAGPVAVKAGQQMCEDPRIPERFREVLEELRDKNATMTPMKFWTLLPPEMQRQIAALGPSRGTGSVKQVNQARLIDGLEAVAAVVRPGVEQDIAESIGALGVVEETRHLVARIEPMLQREIDLISEGASFETLRATPVGQCAVVMVPEVYTATPRAILREDAPGETVAAIMRERQLTPGECARLAEVHRLLVRSALDTERDWLDRVRNRAPDEEALTYVLSDPHQGNLADDGVKLGLFDPGQYEELNPPEADYFVRLLAAFSKDHWMQKQRATLVTELSGMCRLSETAEGDESVRTRLDRAWESMDEEPDAIPERRLQLLLLSASKNGVAVPNGYFGLAKMLHSLQSQETDLGLEPIVENTVRDLRLDQLGPLGRLVRPFV